jgi:hypothetical protein
MYGDNDIKEPLIKKDNYSDGIQSPNMKQLNSRKFSKEKGKRGKELKSLVVVSV